MFTAAETVVLQSRAVNQTRMHTRSGLLIQTIIRKIKTRGPLKSNGLDGNSWAYKSEPTIQVVKPIDKKLAATTKMRKYIIKPCRPTMHISNPIIC